MSTKSLRTSCASAESPGSKTPGDSGHPWSPRALTAVSHRGLKMGTPVHPDVVVVVVEW